MDALLFDIICIVVETNVFNKLVHQNGIITELEMQ